MAPYQSPAGGDRRSALLSAKKRVVALAEALHEGVYPASDYKPAASEIRADDVQMSTILAALGHYFALRVEDILEAAQAEDRERFNVDVAVSTITDAYDDEFGAWVRSAMHEREADEAFTTSQHDQRTRVSRPLMSLGGVR